MTGAELVSRFADYTRQAGHPKLDSRDRRATLYGLDEVVANVDRKTVLLPIYGEAQCPTLDRVRGADWYATVEIPGQGVQFIVGVGDPFVTSPANPLPTKDGMVIAVPYRVIQAGMESTNRAQRRAMSR
ncbi:hypothetical protein [Paucibacter soli]|uniref:hypothetical protein n=1 Tax=Paucibacter soli TaxID=3133433 RepID=UPI0030A0CD7F